MQKPRTFVFFSRIEREKGVHILIDTIISLWKIGFWDTHRIFICWRGNLEWELLLSLAKYNIVDISWNKQVSEKIWQNGIYFLGWKNGEQMESIFPLCDIHLMPSQFLETFGLSALQMCSRWIATVGFSDGGLSQFLVPDLILEKNSKDENNLVSLMQDLVLKEESYFENLRISVSHIAEKYNSGAFVDVFREQFPWCSRVLFFSDYLSLIWGLEKTTQIFSKTLKNYWIENSIFGQELWNNTNTLSRLKHLIGSPINFRWAISIKKAILLNQPDLIWVQGMHRVWGFLWVRAIINSKIQTVAMHHDFGIISPFARDVESLRDIPTKWTLFEFYRVLKKRTLFWYIYLPYKFLLLSLYRYEIRKIGIHLVPSGFMIEPFARLLGIEKSKIRVMPLFLDTAS